jgi:hypothetical protein
LLVGLILDLGGNRLRIGVDLAEHVADDTVLERGVEEVVGVEVEAAPLERRLRGPLEQLASGIAEELCDVDAIRLPGLRRRATRAVCARPVSEEIREEVIEEAAPSAERARHALLREVDLTQVLDLFRPVGETSDPLGYCGSSVTRANGLLLDGHSLSFLSLGEGNTIARRLETWAFPGESGVANMPPVILEEERGKRHNARGKELVS